MPDITDLVREERGSQQSSISKETEENLIRQISEKEATINRLQQQLNREEEERNETYTMDVGSTTYRNISEVEELIHSLVVSQLSKDNLEKKGMEAVKLVDSAINILDRYAGVKTKVYSLDKYKYTTRLK